MENNTEGTSASGTSAQDALEFIKTVERYVNNKVDQHILDSKSSTRASGTGASGTGASDAMQSESVDKLYEALANAQGDFPNIEPNKQIGHLRSSYASYNAIVKAVAKVLKANGLSVTHNADIGADCSILTSVLGHSSGQWTTNKARIIPEKDGMLGYKAAVSGLKRVAFMNLLNITTEDQE